MKRRRGEEANGSEERRGEIKENDGSTRRFTMAGELSSFPTVGRPDAASTRCKPLNQSLMKHAQCIAMALLLRARS